MLHTDQDRQLPCNNYRILQGSWHIKQSMSKRGNFSDNAVIESFFNTLKTEVSYQLLKKIRSDEIGLLTSEFMGH